MREYFEARARPSEVWITRDGREIPFRDMAVTHLVNAARLLRRRAESKAISRQFHDWEDDEGEDDSILTFDLEDPQFMEKLRLMEGRLEELQVEREVRMPLHLPPSYHKIITELAKRNALSELDWLEVDPYARIRTDPRGVYDSDARCNRCIVDALNQKADDSSQHVEILRDTHWAQGGVNVYLVPLGKPVAPLLREDRKPFLRLWCQVLPAECAC